MGEIADMMLDGTLDCETGEYIGDRNKQKYGVESPGFPITYERETTIDYGDEANCTTKDGVPIYRPTKTNCPHCNKLVKKVGLNAHIEAKHKEVVE